MILDPISRLVVYAALHMIGDFAFQSTWMCTQKGKSWEILIYHCLVYTAPMALMLLVSSMTDFVTLMGLATVFLSHILIDALKARWGVVKEIWIDQLLHMGVIILCMAIGWL
jgi:hypothetical protein